MSRFFDGTGNQYIFTPSSAIYNNLAAETLAAWIKITVYKTFGCVIIKDPVNTGNGLTASVNVPNGRPNFFYSGDLGTRALATPGIVLPLNTWAHYCATWDSAGDGKGRIYINGAEIASYTSQTVSHTPNSDAAAGYYFGSDTTGNDFQGYLAEVAVWNKALSSTEVAALAASTTGAIGVASVDPVGYWHLCGASNPEPDASGNGNAGTLVGNPAQGLNSPGFSSCGGRVVANFTISGGTGVAGARVQLLSPDGSRQIYTCDSSGNYTFTVPDLATYRLIADTYGTSSTVQFNKQHTVSLNGANVSNVNFSSIAANASNAPPVNGAF